MPKETARNIARYKMNPEQLNEFEFHKNQAAMAEEERSRNDARRASTKKGAAKAPAKAAKKSKKKA
jgi:hypothetical protein